MFDVLPLLIRINNERSNKGRTIDIFLCLSRCCESTGSRKTNRLCNCFWTISASTQIELHGSVQAKAEAQWCNLYTRMREVLSTILVRLPLTFRFSWIRRSRFLCTSTHQTGGSLPIFFPPYICLPLPSHREGQPHHYIHPLLIWIPSSSSSALMIFLPEHGQTFSHPPSHCSEEKYFTFTHHWIPFSVEESYRLSL